LLAATCGSSMVSRGTRITSVDMLFSFRCSLDRLRSDRLHLYCFGGNSRHDVVWQDVFGSNSHRAEQTMLAGSHPAPYRGAIRDASLWSDLCFLIGDNHGIVEIVRVRVNVGIIGYGSPLTDDDFATVIKQDIFVDHAIVFDGEVIAETDLNAMKDLDVLSEML